MSEIRGKYDAASAKYERFSLEKRSEAFLKNAIKEGRQLSCTFHDTQEQAYVVGRAYVDRYVQAAAELQGLDQLTLQVSGSGVKVVNIAAGHDDEGKIEIDFHPGNPLVELSPFEERQGRYEGIVIMPTQGEDDRHSTMPYIIMQDKKGYAVSVNSEYGFPLSTLSIESHMLVACNGTASIDIPALDAYRARNKAIAELALRSGRSDKQAVMNRVHKLHGALYTENPYGFTPLQRVGDLQMLGRLGAETAETDKERHEAIITVLREMFAHGRAVNLAGDVSYMPQDQLEFHEVSGTIIDVLSVHPNSDTPEPTLVLSCRTQSPDGEALCYAPVSRIAQFHF
jgi:hypothetical protein